MPFTYSKSVLPVLPKPDHAIGGGMAENIPLNTIEDKELRKKLRNRQSALAARERKKARMFELEKQVAELQETSQRVEDENQYLRARLEILVRKCLRNGIVIDSENDMLCASVPRGNSPNTNFTLHDAYPNSANINNERRPLNNFTAFQSDSDLASRNMVNGYTAQRPNGRCYNADKVAANAIQALGRRQNEILQNLSTGFAPQNQAIVKHSNPSFQHTFVDEPRQMNFVDQAKNFQIKQEMYDNLISQEALHPAVTHTFNVNSHNMHRSNADPLLHPTTPIHANAIYKAAADSLPQGNTHLKRREICDDISQSLPSIGSMLTPPSKRQRLDETNRLKSSEMTETKILCGNKAMTAFKNTDDTSITTNRIKSGRQHRDLFEMREDNLVPSTCSEPIIANSMTKEVIDFSASVIQADTTSMSGSFVPQDNLLSENFCDLLDEVDPDTCVKTSVLDLHDIIAGDQTAYSPSAFSDSGLSMEGSLDWMTDNPIFDL